MGRKNRRKKSTVSRRLKINPKKLISKTNDHMADNGRRKVSCCTSRVLYVGKGFTGIRSYKSGNRIKPFG